MAAIHSYLTFNGNCREAMTFYQQCLGGKLVFQYVGEAPESEMLPEQYRQTVLHASLTNGNWILTASDIGNEKELKRGNSVSLLIECNSEREIHELYYKLSQGGVQSQPVQTTHWGVLLGYLQDRFGNLWVLSYPLKR